MKNCSTISIAKYQHYHQAKIDKYEYLTGEELLPANPSQMIQQAKFMYSLRGKAFEKQIKTIENQREKQIKAIEEHGKHLAEINVLD